MNDLKTEVINIRLTKETKDALKAKAKDDDRSMTNFIQKVLKAEVSKEVASK